MAKIHAPNKNYTGITATVPFAAGVGETSDEHLLAWFNEHGYEVEGMEKTADTGSEFDNMSIDELKAYAETNGIDIGQSTSQKGIMKKIIEATKTKTE
jgi:hypothetical protein